MPTISGYASGEPIEAVDINQYFLRGNRNAIINGDMRVGQRANFSVLTAIADGAYGLDRWVALGSGTGGVGSSGQNVNVQQMVDAPTGGLNSMRLMATTNGLKFGCVQIIENRNIAGIRSGTVTVSFKAKDSAGITDVRCAVLGWTSTADSVTRDIISTSGTPWLSTPPTLAANWSYLNTPVNLNVTNSWADYRVNANVTGNPNNLAVFIWVNSTSHTTADDLLITDVQLESGAIATPFERKTFQEQFADCQRYYQQYREPRLRGVIGSTGAPFRMGMVIPPMRTAPTSSTNGGTIGIFDGSTASTPVFSIGNDYTLQNHSVEYDLGGSGFNNFRPALGYYTGATGILFLTAEL
jgi:hypothetical protein